MSDDDIDDGQQDVQVSPEEVARYLREAGATQGPAAAPEITEADLAALRGDSGKKDQEVDDQKVMDDVRRSLSVASPEVESSMDIMTRLMQANVMARTTLTDEDKRAFEEAVLMDTPFRSDVRVMNGSFTCRFRTLTVHERQAVWRYGEKYAGTGPTAIFAMTNDVLKGHVRLMLELVNGSSPAWPPLTLPDDEGAAVEELHKAVAKDIDGMNDARWAVLLHAFRVFEAKHMLAQEHVCSDPNFLPPATDA